MEVKKLKLITPENTIWNSINNKTSYGVNNRCPQPINGYKGNNIIRCGDYFMEEYAAKNASAGRKTYKIIRQKIEHSGDFALKTTTIEPYSSYGFPIHKSVQKLSKDGTYLVERTIGDKKVSGYEMNLNPVKRTFDKGLKGKLQKTAHLIANDTNGCERPILRNIGSFIFNIAKKTK